MSIPSFPDPIHTAVGSQISKSTSKTAILSVSQGRGFGAERVLIELLAGWQAAGHPPLQVIAPRDSSVLEAARRWGHHALVFPATRDALSRNLLAAWQSVGPLRGIQRMHAWTARAFDPAYLIARYLNLPLTGTLHDHPRAVFHGFIRQRMIQKIGAQMRPLVCVSDAVRQACLEAGFPEAFLKTLHNGLQPLVAEPRTHGEGPLCVAFLGMHTRGKGFDLIKPWISQSIPGKYTWQLYGDPREDYANWVAQTGRSDIHLEGFQPAELIFSKADVLLHTSTAFDSFPTVLLEAARMGIPALASLGGGAKEIVKEGETGWLFHRDHAEQGFLHLEALHANPELLERMGLQARRHFEKHFLLQDMVDSYREIWKGER